MLEITCLAPSIKTHCVAAPAVLQQTGLKGHWFVNHYHHYHQSSGILCTVLALTYRHIYKRNAQNVPKHIIMSTQWSLYHAKCPLYCPLIFDDVSMHQQTKHDHYCHASPPPPASHLYCSEDPATRPESVFQYVRHSTEEECIMISQDISLYGLASGYTADPGGYRGLQLFKRSRGFARWSKSTITNWWNVKIIQEDKKRRFDGIIQSVCSTFKNITVSSCALSDMRSADLSTVVTQFH